MGHPSIHNDAEEEMSAFGDMLAALFGIKRPNPMEQADIPRSLQLLDPPEKKPETKPTAPLCPLQVGDLVRETDSYVRSHKGQPGRSMEPRRGVVLEVGQSVKLHTGYVRCRIKVKTKMKFGRTMWYDYFLTPNHEEHHHNRWKKETDREIEKDQKADLMIKAYQEGDKTALIPLIDRLIELINGE